MVSGFVEIASILGVVVVFGALAVAFRQPLVGVFVLTGIFVGPSGLRIISSHEQFELLGSIGISLLLFIGGLKLDVRLLRQLGHGIVLTGVTQVVLTALLAVPVAFAVCGANPTPVTIVALCLAFSSTVVGLKVLADRNELDSLPGMLSLGISLVQDFVVILCLLWLDVAGGREGSNRLFSPWLGVPTGAALLGALFGVGTIYLPKLMQHFARNAEFLTLFALTWATLVAALCETLGLSKELGAFVAGLTFAASPFRDAIGSRLAPLRDFLILFFFLDVGARIQLTNFGAQLSAALLMLAFGLIVKPLVIFALFTRFGYSARTALTSAVPLIPMSEFTFLLTANALRTGLLSGGQAAALTLAGLGSFLVAPYLMNRVDNLFRAGRLWLERWETSTKDRESIFAPVSLNHAAPEIIVIGLGEYGLRLAEFLARRRCDLLGIDFNPDVLRAASQRGLAVLYGDAEDETLYEHLPLEQTRWVVCTLRPTSLARVVLGILSAHPWRGRIAVRADNDADAEFLEACGAHLVLRPYLDAAELAADALTTSAEIVFHLGKWPIAFREIRIPSDSPVAGQSLAELALRATTGASVLAVSRAGRVTLDPPSNFVLYPNDRVLAMGSSQAIAAAEERLTVPAAIPTDDTFQFDVAEVVLPPDSSLVGRSLASHRFRHMFGVSVAAVQRKGAWILELSGDFVLHAGDVLLIVGPAQNVYAFAGSQAVTPMQMGLPG